MRQRDPSDGVAHPDLDGACSQICRAHGFDTDQYGVAARGLGIKANLVVDQRAGIGQADAECGGGQAGDVVIAESARVAGGEQIGRSGGAGQHGDLYAVGCTDGVRPALGRSRGGQQNAADALGGFKIECVVIGTEPGLQRSVHAGGGTAGAQPGQAGGQHNHITH